ncbi:MAG TPA: hypothetical protein VMW75_17780 [Thermoanaerobaculia bacterium]|nr:hypothetical protein [Thermoanaerobaculia bacterium]
MAIFGLCWALVGSGARWTSVAMLQSAITRPASHGGADWELILKVTSLLIALGMAPWAYKLFRRQVVDSVVSALDTQKRDQMVYDRVAYGLGCLLRDEILRRQFAKEVVDALATDKVLHLTVAEGLGRLLRDEVLRRQFVQELVDALDIDKMLHHTVAEGLGHLLHSDKLVSQETIEGLLERMTKEPYQRERFRDFVNDDSVSAQAAPPETDPEEVKARYQQILKAIRLRAPDEHELPPPIAPEAGSRTAPPKTRRSRKVAAYTAEDRAGATVAPPARPRRKSPKPKI